MTDRALIRRYRLPSAEIRRLVEVVAPHVRRPTQRNFALSPEVQVLAALRFYACGSIFHMVGDGTALSKASVSRCVAAVTPILVRHARQHIQLPTTREEVRAVHQGFYDMAGIPRVMGLLDGTLIPLHNPVLVDPCWVCRKHFTALNVQVVVDDVGLIRDIVARWPGATHDAFMWENSSVGERAARGEYGASFFLGDSGYPLRTYLITPVPEPETPAEEAFNESHTTTRTHIERVFGRWKARFRCLSRSAGGLRLPPLKACQVIVVTAMLHNIAVRAGLPDVEQEEEEDDEDDDDQDPPLPPPGPHEPRNVLYQAGLRTRQALIELF